ncbi:hypothetical protein KI655_12655 [Vibrio sp. D404a]|uniref:hypothetical protein n=1 Tax=unclassified Vibrio TaxID=2614977 RepID=UPI00255270B3|nr:MULTISPECIES: hypothetical protein [unclassified Vibrio]MDK9738147.1 hypothetical protein [Vibrio sp. D404a]MDK9796438.1 hypothetical protein [Vibrio sp. D449a]
MKYILSITLLMALVGCTDKDTFEINLESSSGKESVSVSKGNAVVTLSGTEYKMKVKEVKLSGKAFVLEPVGNSIDRKLPFDYQKKTDTWLCTSCVQIELPVSWNKI